MNLFVTRRAEPDRRLEFKGKRPHWLPLFVFVLGVMTGTALFWLWFLDGP